jgi:hypothetical protein
MATKKVTTKTATNGKAQPARMAPDDLRAAMPEAEVNPLFVLEAPAIAPEFVGTLEMDAHQYFYTWLENNAPREVFELYCFTESMEIYLDEIRRNNGQVAHEHNVSVVAAVPGCINAIAAMGGVFAGVYIYGPRKQAVKS